MRGSGKTDDLKSWFGKSKIVDDEGEPLVAYKAMEGDVPHMADVTRHDARRPRGKREQIGSAAKDVQFARSTSSPRTRSISGKAEHRDWLVKEMTKPKNVEKFNEQMGEDHGHYYPANEIEAGIEEGPIRRTEMPVVFDLIKARGHDGIYMVEQGGEHEDAEPRRLLAVTDPNQEVALSDVPVRSDRLR